MPLPHDDTRDLLRAIRRVRAQGRIVEAVEVNPTRRTAAGPWSLLGAQLVSNGLVPTSAFDLKLQGEVFEYDTSRCYFSTAALTRGGS